MDGDISNKRVLLVPVDSTEVSAKVCKFVIDQLYREGDELLLLHVIPKFQAVVLASDYYGLSDQVLVENADRQEELEVAARERMKTLFEPLLKLQHVSYTIKVLKGMTDASSVGQHICQEAEQATAAMVVMARHHKGALQEFFLGSATNFCTHHSKVPVLVLPEQL